MTEQLTTQTPTSQPNHRPRFWGRLAAGIVTAATLAGGVLVLGRLAATETLAMVLTGLWFAVALVAAALVVRPRRHLAVPVGTGYVAAALAVAILLGLPQLRDREVSEQVITGAPAADDVQDETIEDPPEDTAGDVGADSAGRGNAEDPDDSADSAEESADRGNVQVSTGEFMGLAHPGEGTATIVERATGDRVLTLTGFSTDDGPDLRVYLTTDDPDQGDIGEFVDLGALKGNRGDQQYEIDARVDHEQYPYAVVWCRAFSVGFTSAELAPNA